MNRGTPDIPLVPCGMSLRMRSFTVTLVSTLVAVACGGGAQEPATPPASSTAPAAAATPEPAAPSAWSDSLSKEEKVTFMKQSVVPRMSPVFQANNADRYADFSCRTCHGPDFKHPSDFLPKLTMKEGSLTAFADEPQVAQFMQEKVVPEMATLFGEQPYDPQTHQGFGCGGCHKVEMN